MNMSYVWLIVVILSAIIEAATAQLVSIWVVAGGVAGLIASLFTDDIYIQCGIFIVVLVISLIVFMPIINKSKHFKKTKTNADRYIGKEAIVVEEINNTLGKGQVNVLGSIWTANSYDGKIIKKGEKVIIDKISGVKLIVHRNYNQHGKLEEEQI